MDNMELCPVCHRATGITIDNYYRRHTRKRNWMNPWTKSEVCPGSGTKAVVINGQFTEPQ